MYSPIYEASEVPTRPKWKGPFRRNAGVGGEPIVHEERHCSDCLVTAPRGLHYNVENHESGPFRAVRDGNRLLAPLGYSVKKVPPDFLTDGDFVYWSKGQIVGVYS